MLSLNIYFQVLTIAAHHIKLSFQKMKEKESNIIILGTYRYLYQENTF